MSQRVQDPCPLGAYVLAEGDRQEKNKYVNPMVYLKVTHHGEKEKQRREGGVRRGVSHLGNPPWEGDI